MKKTLAAIVVLCAGPISAVEFDSNQDVLAQFQVARTQSPARIESVMPAAADNTGKIILAEKPTFKITAQPVGSNVSRDRFVLMDTAVIFVINNDKDRVGARLEFCEKNYDDLGPRCNVFLFHFPELTYDASAKEIKLGAEVIQKNGFWGPKKNPGYKLGFTRTERVRDGGFDRAKEYVYDVYLEKVSK